MARLLRDLNAENTDQQSCGIVIMPDPENGDDVESIADAAHVAFFDTEREMYAAAEVAEYLRKYIDGTVHVKLLSSLGVERFAIIVDSDEHGGEEDSPYIAWAPHQEFDDRLAIPRI